MAGRITDETLNVTMEINGGNAAQAELGKLERAQRDIKQASEDLRKEKTRLIAAGKKESDEYRKLSKSITENNTKLRQNRADQSKLRKEVGLTGLTMRQLVKESRSLKGILANLTPGTADWKKYNGQLQQVNTRIKQVSTEMRGTKTVMNSTNGSIVNQAKSWGSLVLGVTSWVTIITSALSYAKQFISDSREMAREAKGVDFAFNRIANSSEILKSARVATRGLLSDLDIKKSTVQLDNFGLSTGRVNTLLEFAAVRASQTGDNVGKLVDQITLGLGRKSVQRLDDLGVTQAQINKEMEKGKDFMQAFTDIAARGLSEAGEQLDKGTSKSIKLNAQFDNLKVAVGQLFQSNTSNGFFEILAFQLQRLTTGMKMLKIGVASFTIGFNAMIDPIKEALNSIFPGFSSRMGSLLKAFTTPGITVFADALIKLGAIMGGLGAIARSLKTNFKNLLGVLSLFTQIDIDPLNPVKTFQSLRDFDFTTAFSKLKNQFEEGGKDLGGAFSKGYNDVLKKLAAAKKTATTDDPNVKTELTDEEKKAIAERIKQITALEEKYDKEREERQAKSLVARAQLEKSRAVAEAEALRASKAIIEKIETEHNFKIFQALKQQQEQEMAIRQAFENKKQQLLNQFELDNTTSDRERELLQADQKLLKQEEDFAKDIEALNISENEKARILYALEETRRKTIEDINRKYDEKRLASDAQLQAKMIQNRNQTLNAFIDLAGRETKVGQALIFAKQLFAAKEAVIALGLFKTKSTLKTAEASQDIASGTAKSAAAAPFPANIPLVLGFLAQVAGLVTTIKGFSKQSVKTSGFESGLYPNKIPVTRHDGRKFSAVHGGGTATQVVNKPTYFNDYLTGERGPEMIIDSPTFRQLDPQIINHIMTVNRTVRGFESGLAPSPASIPQSAESNQLAEMTVNIMQRLLIKLDEPLAAYSVIGYKEAEEIQELNDERSQSSTNSKL